MEKDNQHGKTRDLFKRVKEITGKFTPRIGIVKDQSGRSLYEAKEVRER